MQFFPDSKIIFSFYGIHVTWYALFVLGGAFLAYWLCCKQFKKWGYSIEVFENFFLMMLPIGFIGARLYFVLFEWQNYIHDPLSIFYIWEGGIAMHGGIIAATIFGYFYFRRKKFDGLRIVDVIFTNLLLAQAVGRWGNFINQEAYGRVVNEKFYDLYPSFIKERMYIDGAFREPTFLYESVANIFGFLLIRFVYKKYGRRKRGDLAFAYFMWYGMVRFFVEAMRSDALMAGDFRIAQLVSLGMVAFGVMGIMGIWDRVFKKYFPFKRKKPVVIFDLDGTLVDTKDLIFETFKHTFAKYKPGYTLSEAELKAFLGPSLQQSFEQYFEDEQIGEIIQYYRAFNRENHDEYVKAMPHVEEILQYLKEHHYQVGVVSNKLSDIVKMGLHKFHLDSYFEVILGAEEIGEAKPSPMGILKAAKELGEGCDDIVYVGDAPSDIQACKACEVFSVAYVYDKSQLSIMQGEQPCVLIEEMHQLIDVLKEDREWSDNTI